MSRGATSQLRRQRPGAPWAIRFSRITLCCAFFLAPHERSMAQGWFPWEREHRPYGYSERTPPQQETKRKRRTTSERRSRTQDRVQDGCSRPIITPKVPSVVAFPHGYPMNSIVIDTSRRKLYFILEEGYAYEYSVSVGRVGFTWAGTETVTDKKTWPDWYPPSEMRLRDPSLPKKMTGGVRN